MTGGRLLKLAKVKKSGLTKDDKEIIKKLDKT